MGEQLGIWGWYLVRCAEHSHPVTGTMTRAGTAAEAIANVAAQGFTPIDAIESPPPPAHFGWEPWRIPAKERLEDGVPIGPERKDDSE